MKKDDWIKLKSRFNKKRKKEGEERQKTNLNIKSFAF